MITISTLATILNIDDAAHFTFTFWLLPLFWVPLRHSPSLSSAHVQLHCTLAVYDNKTKEQRKSYHPVKLCEIDVWELGYVSLVKKNSRRIFREWPLASLITHARIKTHQHICTVKLTDSCWGNQPYREKAVESSNDMKSHMNHLESRTLFLTYFVGSFRDPGIICPIFSWVLFIARGAQGGPTLVETLPAAEVNSDDKVLEPGLSSTLKERLGVIGCKGIHPAKSWWCIEE